MFFYSHLYLMSIRSHVRLYCNSFHLLLHTLGDTLIISTSTNSIIFSTRLKKLDIQFMNGRHTIQQYRISIFLTITILFNTLKFNFLFFFVTVNVFIPSEVCLFILLRNQLTHFYSAVWLLFFCCCFARKSFNVFCIRDKGSKSH